MPLLLTTQYEQMLIAQHYGAVICGQGLYCYHSGIRLLTGNVNYLRCEASRNKIEVVYETTSCVFTGWKPAYWAWWSDYEYKFA